MSTATAAKPETEVAIICEDCKFQIPQYAKTPLQRTRALRVDRLECPTCHSAYLLTLEKVRHTNLAPKDLDAVRNRNR